MTASSTATRTAPTVVAAIAGVVVLAFVGAPQSVNTVLLAGFDQPKLIGAQLLIGLAGAVGTGVAVLLVHHWARLILVGALLVTVSYLAHPLPRQGTTARVVTPGEATRQPDVVVNAGWVALLVGGAAVVLIGVFGAAGRLVRSGNRGGGAAIAGLGAASGYLGMLLVSWLPTGWPQVVVLALAVLGIAASVVVGRAGGGEPLPTRLVLPACVAALLPLVPTLTVAVTGEPTYESAVGTVVCVLVLAGALVTAAAAGIPVLRGAIGAGLVLAAPLPLLVLMLADAHETSWWAAAVPAALVMAVLLTTSSRPIAVTGVLIEAVALGCVAAAGTDDDAVEWLFYLLAAGVVLGAAGVGALVVDSVALPVLVPTVTAVAVGIRVVLNAIQLRPSVSGMGSLFGSGVLWLSVVMVVAGGLMLFVRGPDSGHSLRR